MKTIEIPGYKDYYISDTGILFVLLSNSGYKLKPRVNNYGYSRVRLYNDGMGKEFQVHRLVAQAFIDNPDDKPTVNHIDGDKSNNSVHNLEWLTINENIQHFHLTKC